MRFRVAAATALLAASVPAQHALAQPAAPAPILETSINPPRVVVGQPVTLRIDVLAPNYMTAPPELPGFQIRNAVTRQLPNVNLNDRRNGTSYAGVRFEFAIHPQEPGSYAIAGQKVTVKYAAEPPAVREETLTIPRTAFEAFIPDSATGLQPFVAATRLSIEQTVQRSSEQLATGGSVTRTVTIKAEGTPAMLLPPTTLAAMPGLALYPAQPQLQDRTESRTDTLSSTRTDSATYMLQQPGNYVLPAVELHWWNASKGEIELARADAVPLQVGGISSATSPAPADDAQAHRTWQSLIALTLDHWRLALPAAIMLAVLLWVIPRAVRALATAYRLRQESYRRSESFSFDQLRQAAANGDAGKVYFAMLAWLHRFEPVAPDHLVRTLETKAGDPALDREVGLLEQRLFGRQVTPGDWSPRELLRRVKATRRDLRRRSERVGTTRRLQQLNPDGGRERFSPVYRRSAHSNQHPQQGRSTT